jgi:hypothetical protein
MVGADQDWVAALPNAEVFSGPALVSMTPGFLRRAVGVTGA